MPDEDVAEKTHEYPVVASTSIKTYHKHFKVKPPVITTGRSGSLGTVLFVNENAWPLNTSLYVKNFHGNSCYLVFYTLKNMGLENFNAGAGVPSLNRNHLSGITMAVPPKPLQDRFESVVAPLFQQKYQLVQANDLLGKTRDSLLPRLISGKLSVENLDIQFPLSMQDEATSYGSYDYLSPAVFRVSNTALSLGTTAQYWVAPGIALQGSLLGGVGFGAAGTTPASEGDRDYHYGVAPQGLLALRLLFGNRAALELDARGYYVAGSGEFNSLSTGSNPVDAAGGSEKILRIKTGFNIRVYGRHGLGLQYVESIRDSQYGGQPARHQRDGTVSLVYTFVGSSHFGAVEWRDNGNR